MSQSAQRVYSVVDLFAGAGGLSYGFARTGRYEIKAAYECDPGASATYVHNHTNTIVFSDVCGADYTELVKQIGPVDVVIGGPPCQGFSNANRQKNSAVNQNNRLIKEFVRSVIELKPMAFVMENVSMLKSDIHRFYVDSGDRDLIRVCRIPTKKAKIILLNRKFIFDQAKSVVEDESKIRGYLWPEDDYLSLNVVYRISNNKEKCKRILQIHETRLRKLSKRILECDVSDDPIRVQDVRAARALSRYYSGGIAESEVVSEVENALMIQRMLSKASELFQNGIEVSGFEVDGDLIAHVTTMTVLDYIECILDKKGYAVRGGVLKAAEFGVPQKRERYVIVGVKKCITEEPTLPVGSVPTERFGVVCDVISDLEAVKVGENASDKPYADFDTIPFPSSELGKRLRDSAVLYNHIAPSSSAIVKKRFAALRPGQNFHDLAPSLKETYSDAERTQNTIYLRLRYDQPSGTVVNVRKSMWIHPVLHRGISVREAARLQTFPDSFVFLGLKNSQYQQVGNAVPPVLAEAIAMHLASILDTAKTEDIPVAGVACALESVGKGDIRSR